MRGNASAGASNEPLIVIDDVVIRPVRISAVDRRTTTEPAMNALDFVNPADIEYVDVLRGPAATTQYGADAANGVIRIYTKRGRPKGGYPASSRVRCPD
jgi:TonB-dependent SusC/RagA subfamily outer membrane receptor